MLSVCFRDYDARVVEGAAPSYHAVVEVRVGEADGVYAAKRFYCLDCVVVEQTNAVVEDIAVGSLQQ